MTCLRLTINRARSALTRRALRIEAVRGRLCFGDIREWPDSGDRSDDDIVHVGGWFLLDM